MSVVGWRIIQRKLVKTAFSGDGARQFGGRWNSPGRAVVYAAQSLALAALEILVHIDSAQVLAAYVAIPVTIDANLITQVDASALPDNWGASSRSKATRAIGDQWAIQGSSAVLQVPSAVIPLEFNFLLNPAHKDFAKLRMGTPTRFRFDRRLGTKS